MLFIKSRQTRASIRLVVNITQHSFLIMPALGCEVTAKFSMQISTLPHMNLLQYSITNADKILELITCRVFLFFGIQIL